MIIHCEMLIIQNLQPLSFNSRHNKSKSDSELIIMKRNCLHCPGQLQWIDYGVAFKCNLTRTNDSRSSDRFLNCRILWFSIFPVFILASRFWVSGVTESILDADTNNDNLFENAPRTQLGNFDEIYDFKLTTIFISASLLFYYIMLCSLAK